MKHLGEFEQKILLALMRLDDNAYGVTVRREICERAGRDVSIGAVYTILERLEQQGLVRSRRGKATRERGGRAKRFFKITAPGIRALNDALTSIDRMRAGLSLA